MKKYIFILLILLQGYAYTEETSSSYLDFLEKHSHFKQTGNHRLGEIEIVTDLKKISEIQELEYKRLIESGVEPEVAKNWACPGIAYTDPYLLILRDPVIFPNGKSGFFKRMVWKCTLNGEKPIAVLPIDQKGRICLIKIWRHATGSWELEIPRGAPSSYESPIKNALRELKEETGFIADRILFLGSMNPDSGILSTNLDIFLAFSSKQIKSNPDENEIISHVYCFNLNELEQGIKNGFVEIQENKQSVKVPLRDPFLTFALFQARIRNLLPN
jgi:ADP-ribose pyrophosphatase